MVSAGTALTRSIAGIARGGAACLAIATASMAIATRLGADFDHRGLHLGVVLGLLAGCFAGGWVAARRSTDFPIACGITAGLPSMIFAAQVFDLLPFAYWLAPC
jgi:hypothetical protein